MSKSGSGRGIVFRQERMGGIYIHHPEHRGARSGSAEYDLHKLFVIYLNPSVSVGVDSLESFCQSLDHNTSPHKTIKSDPRLNAVITPWPRSIFLFYQGQQLWRELISKAIEGGSQFVSVDRTGVVPVEVSKNALPVLDVSPKPLELIEPDSPTTVGVENVHEHLDRIKVKLRQVSIN